MSIILTSDLQTWFKKTHDIDITSIPSEDGMKWIKNRNIFLKKIFGEYAITCSLFDEQTINNNKELKKTILEYWSGEQYNPNINFEDDIVHRDHHYPEFSRIISITRDIRTNKHRKHFDGRTVGEANEKEDVLDYLEKQGGNLLSEIIDEWIKENRYPQRDISISDLIPNPSDSVSDEEEEEETEEQEEQDTITVNHVEYEVEDGIVYNISADCETMGKIDHTKPNNVDFLPEMLDLHQANVFR